MPLSGSDDGTWDLRIENNERSNVEGWNLAYREALPRYMTSLDPAFTRAYAKCEFEFLASLLHVRGAQDAG
ncbi:MAG: hypothetical protein V3S85_03395 [Nitrospirales bacterium]